MVWHCEAAPRFLVAMRIFPPFSWIKDESRISRLLL